MDILKYALNKNPVIVSLTDINDLKKALQTENSIIIIIQADLRTLKNTVDKIKETDNLAFVHMNFIKGLKGDLSGIQFLAENIGIDGIVSTHPNLIQTAKRLNLLTIQRVFILDSASIKQGLESINESKPDAVEILPGIAVPYLKQYIKKTFKPIIIAAGLINTEDEITEALMNGAQGISSSATDLWKASSSIKKKIQKLSENLDVKIT